MIDCSRAACNTAGKQHFKKITRGAEESRPLEYFLVKQLFVGMPENQGESVMCLPLFVFINVSYSYFFCHY